MTLDPEGGPLGRLRGRYSRTRERLGDLTAGSLLLFVSQIVGNAGYFVAAVVLARALPTAERGTVAFLTLAGLLIGRVTRLGVPEATRVLVASEPELRGPLLSNLVAWTIGASGTAALLATTVIITTGWHVAGITTVDAVALGVAIPAVVLFKTLSAASSSGAGELRQRR